MNTKSIQPPPLAADPSLKKSTASADDIVIVPNPENSSKLNESAVVMTESDKVASSLIQVLNPPSPTSDASDISLNSNNNNDGTLNTSLLIDDKSTNHLIMIDEYSEEEIHSDDGDNNSNTMLGKRAPIATAEDLQSLQKVEG